MYLCSIVAYVSYIGDDCDINILFWDNLEMKFGFYVDDSNTRTQIQTRTHSKHSQ